MPDNKRILMLMLALSMLLCSMLAAMFRSNGESSASAQNVSEQPAQSQNLVGYPEQLHTSPYVRLAHRLSAYTMDSESAFTGKTYLHNEKYRGMKVYNGLDVSAKQKGIDWITLSQYIDFAFIRVGYRGYSEGGIFVDERFHSNMRSALKMNIKTGVYFYSQAISCDEIREEARVMLENIAGYDIALPDVLDIEYAEVGGGLGGRLHEAGLSEDEITEMCRAFCEVIRSAGYTPMIYANSYMLNNRIDGSRLDGCAIWVAYPATENGYEGDYTCWQYSWTGRVPGVTGDVDCNYIYGYELSNAAFNQTA